MMDMKNVAHCRLAGEHVFADLVIGDALVQSDKWPCLCSNQVGNCGIRKVVVLRCSRCGVEIGCEGEVLWWDPKREEWYSVEFEVVGYDIVPKRAIKLRESLLEELSDIGFGYYFRGEMELVW